MARFLNRRVLIKKLIETGSSGTKNVPEKKRLKTGRLYDEWKKKYYDTGD